MNKKPKISAEVSVEEFDAYKNEAARLGMTMSEWLRRSLNSSLPTRWDVPDVAEAAFQQLDQQDAVGGVMTEVVKPVEKPQPVFQTLAQAPVQATVAHPCLLLNPQRPGVLNAGECSGTCMAQSQRGKPCFFGAVTAHKCPLFSARVVPPAPVQNMRARK